MGSSKDEILFSALENPAFLSFQHNAIASAELSLSPEGHIGLRSGVARSDETGGYGLFFSQDIESRLKDVCLTTTVGREWFRGGVNFHFRWNEGYPMFTFDAAALVRYRPTEYVSLSLQNALPTDTAVEELSPSLSLTKGGALFSHFFYAADLFTQVMNIHEREYSLGGRGELRLHLFENPALDVMVDGRFERTSEGAQRAKVGGLLGTSFLLREKLFATHLGAAYDPLEGKSEVYFSVTFNPLSPEKIEIGKVELKISLSSDTLSLDGSGEDLFVSIHTAQSAENVIERWSLTVYRNDGHAKSPVRTYQGGGIPPSTIRFEGRDSHGQLLPAGAYGVQATVKTAKREQASSPLLHFQIR